MNRRLASISSVGLLLLLLAARTTQGQTLLTQTTWGGVGSDVAEAVATSADGASYVAGITDSFAIDQFGNPSPRVFVVKFAADGSLTWQRIWNGPTVRGLGRPDVAVSSDGSVYVTGVTVDNGNDAVLLKFDASGTLQWERRWGGASSDESLAVATASDGSAYIAGTDRNGETAEGVAVAPDGTIYVAGTTTSFGAGSQDAFVLHLQSTGKKLLDAVTWGGTGFETGADVSVSGNTVWLAATTTTAPPYFLLDAAAKISTPRGTLATPAGTLDMVSGVVADPGLGAATPDGTTTYGGNFEAALVRIAR